MFDHGGILKLFEIDYQWSLLFKKKTNFGSDFKILLKITVNLVRNRIK